MQAKNAKSFSCSYRNLYEHRINQFDAVKDESSSKRNGKSPHCSYGEADPESDSRQLYVRNRVPKETCISKKDTDVSLLKVSIQLLQIYHRHNENIARMEHLDLTIFNINQC